MQCNLLPPKQVLILLFQLLKLRALQSSLLFHRHMKLSPDPALSTLGLSSGCDYFQSCCYSGYFSWDLCSASYLSSSFTHLHSVLTGSHGVIL